MDKSLQTMIDNLFAATGKTLDEWIEIVRKENFVKHGEMLTYLKQIHGLTHGYANLIAHKVKGSDAGSAENVDDLITKQYTGKEHFFPLYQHLIRSISAFGPDVEIAPKNAYVSVRRKKQFAMLIPATKSRFEIGVNLKDQETLGALEKITSANAMCSHKINLNAGQEPDAEILNWLKKAYDQAG
jgi:predicted transport protein